MRYAGLQWQLNVLDTIRIRVWNQTPHLQQQIARVSHSPTHPLTGAPPVCRVRRCVCSSRASRTQLARKRTGTGSTSTPRTTAMLSTNILPASGARCASLHPTCAATVPPLNLAAAAPTIPLSLPSFCRVPPGMRSIHPHKCL